MLLEQSIETNSAKKDVTRQYMLVHAYRLTFEFLQQNYYVHSEAMDVASNPAHRKSGKQKYMPN